MWHVIQINSNFLPEATQNAVKHLQNRGNFFQTNCNTKRRLTIFNFFVKLLCKIKMDSKYKNENNFSNGNYQYLPQIDWAILQKIPNQWSKMNAKREARTRFAFSMLDFDLCLHAIRPKCRQCPTKKWTQWMKESRTLIEFKLCCMYIRTYFKSWLEQFWAMLRNHHQTIHSWKEKIISSCSI